MLPSRRPLDNRYPTGEELPHGVHGSSKERARSAAARPFVSSTSCNYYIFFFSPCTCNYYIFFFSPCNYASVFFTIIALSLLCPSEYHRLQVQSCARQQQPIVRPQRRTSGWHSSRHIAGDGCALRLAVHVE